MTTKYDRSQREVARLATILKNGQSLPDNAESQSLTTLVQTGFHTILNLVKEQNDEIRGKCLNADAVFSRQFDDNLTQSENAIKEVVLACHTQSLADAGNDVLDKPLISSFYNYADGQYDQAVVKESDIRSIPLFLGDKTPSDVLMEQLLLQLNQVGLQLKLNEQGLKSVLFKRLGGKALQVIQSTMELMNLAMDTISFTQLVSLCESSYMKNSNPRAAKLALHQMTKLPVGSRSFMELEASVVRLARLSCRDILDQHEREILFKTRSLEQFLSCLQSTDKSLIDRQNTQRLSSGLDFLTLHASVQFLENHYRDNQVGGIPALQYDSTVHKASNDAPEVDGTYPCAYWVGQRGRYPQRGTPGGRGGQFRGGGRQSFPQRQKAPPPPYRGGGFPKRGQSRPQNQSYQRNGPPGNVTGGHRQRADGARGQSGEKQKIQFSHEKLNIADRSCFLCGVPGHRWTDSSCCYHGTPLVDSPCRKCGQAGHLTKLCIGPIQAAVIALKKQKEQAKYVHSNMDQIGSVHDHMSEQQDVGNLDDLFDHIDLGN